MSTQQVFCGDNIELLKQYPDNHFDSIVTDAPYGLGKEPNAVELMKDWVEKGYHEISGSGFMGKEWDAFVPQPLFWKEAFRVLKHGGHVLSFFGTRTYDWGVMAMRFAGFEIRDTITYNYGSGFPKSHNIINVLKNELKCKVEKVNVNAAMVNLYQQRKTKEMDGQDIVVENVLVKVKKEGYLEFVKIVPKNFTLQMLISKDNIEDSKEIFALLSVNLNGNQKTSILKIILIGKGENLLEQMDTLQLTWEKENIDLNTILLWRNISEQKFQLDKMFTTLTGIEATTESKICNYFLNQNIQSCITNNHSALKPASEPIVLARKPLEKGLSIAENVLKWGTGGINIDGCRIGTDEKAYFVTNDEKSNFEGNTYGFKDYENMHKRGGGHNQGRFPANVIFSHSQNCLENTCVDGCPIKELDEQSGVLKSGERTKDYPLKNKSNSLGVFNVFTSRNSASKGGASRFFYTAKSSKGERNKGLEGFEQKEKPNNYIMPKLTCTVCGSKRIDSNNKLVCGCNGDTHYEEQNSGDSKNNLGNKNFNIHPTVKPIKLMQYLVRLITPPNGIVLDPFNGSGTTGIAAKLEGLNYVGLELDAEYCKISEARIAAWEVEKPEVDNQLNLF